LAALRLVLFAAGIGAGGLGRGAAESLALFGGHGHQLAQQHRNGEIVVDGHFHELGVEHAGDNSFFGAREQAYSISYVHNLRLLANPTKYAPRPGKVATAVRVGAKAALKQR